VLGYAEVMDVVIQPAAPADVVPIALMSRRLVESGLPSWSWTPQRVARQLRNRESLALTARAGDELAGFAIMTFGDEVAHLALFAVEPAWRRQGIGSRMVRWLEETAVVAGTFRVQLELRAANRPAQLFYRSLGYRERGRLIGYYEQLEDAIRMVRDLRVVRLDPAH
jgi:ribosomal-protein-alanine N-acetyltransferase